MLAEARGHAVVHDHAVLAQHQAIAALADLELGPGVGVHAVEELGRVLALDVDLAERRGVDHAERVAHRLDLAVDGVVHGFAGPRVIPGPLPLADVLEGRAVALVPGVDRRLAGGIEQVVDIAAGEDAEGDRGIGRAEGGDAHFRDRPAERLGDDADGIHVAGLALIGAHAGGGVALDVLDRAVALAQRQLEVVGGDVVQQVDEVLAALAERPVRGHQPLPARRQEGCVAGFGYLLLAPLGLEPSGLGRILAGGETLGQTGGQAEGAVAGARRALGLSRLAGHEAAPRLVEDHLAARLAEQVHRRVPSARDGKQIAVERLGFAFDARAVRADPGDPDPGDPLAAARPDDGVAGEHGQAVGLRALRGRPFRLGPQIDDTGDLDARGRHVEGGAVGAVVVGEDDRLGARLDGVAVEVGSAGFGQHDARAVVVAEHQGPLDRAGGEHHLVRAQLPQALARQAIRLLDQMVGDPLDEADEVVIEIGVGRGPGQDRDLVVGFQARPRRGHPVERRLAADGLVLRTQQCAAQSGVLLGQDDPGAGLGGGERRGQAGRPGADHQHVAVRVGLVVMVRVALSRRLAEAGGVADDVLVLHPQGSRPHEGLVIEAGGKNARQLVERCAHVEADAGPAVLGFGGQALDQLDLGGAHVGVAACALAELQQRVRLLRAGGEDAARAVVLEAASDQVHAVGEQRRGQGVAGIALIGRIVEAEADRLGPVDQAPLGQAEALSHGRSAGQTARRISSLGGLAPVS